jgi:hypothetical protein
MRRTASDAALLATADVRWASFAQEARPVRAIPLLPYSRLCANHRALRCMQPSPAKGG